MTGRVRISDLLIRSCKVALSIKLWAAFQSVVSFTLLAQFLLALRQRFRMR
ncbi:MAG: hypothetical protein O2807_02640 [bacterium]|nr:hypothetical protein [bacterium]